MAYNKMYRYRNSGFTLIELLVVIAIMGLLTSVAVLSLSSANKKGKDAAVQSDLAGVRAQAQLYYNANSGYGTNSALEPGCPVLNISSGTITGPTDNVFSDPTIVRQIIAADNANGASLSITCAVSAGGVDFAVAGGLSTGNYYCTDSNGFAGKILSLATVTSSAKCQ